MAVPTETARYMITTHGFVPGDNILDISGKNVPVMRQAVSERRSVIENEILSLCLPESHRFFECPVGFPEIEHFMLDRGEIRFRGDRTEYSLLLCAGTHCMEYSPDFIDIQQSNKIYFINIITYKQQYKNRNEKELNKIL